MEGLPLTQASRTSLSDAPIPPTHSPAHITRRHALTTPQLCHRGVPWPSFDSSAKGQWLLSLATLGCRRLRPAKMALPEAWGPAGACVALTPGPSIQVAQSAFRTPRPMQDPSADLY